MNNTSRWNMRYANSEHLFGIKPNNFMVNQINLLPSKDNTSKQALSIADGEAFNSIWLAQKGYTVTSIDITPAAHEKASQNVNQYHTQRTNNKQSIHLICADILHYPLPPASFDLITVFFLHIHDAQRQELNKKIIQLLKPGGIILYECFHTDQGTPAWGPKSTDLLINEKSILRDFTDFKPLFINKDSTTSYEENQGQKNVITLQYAGLKK